MLGLAAGLLAGNPATADTGLPTPGPSKLTSAAAEVHVCPVRFEGSDGEWDGGADAATTVGQPGDVSRGASRGGPGGGGDPHGVERFLVVKSRVALAQVARVEMPWRTGRLTAWPSGGALELRDGAGRVTGLVPSPMM